MIKKFINFRNLFLLVFFFSASFNVAAQNEEATVGAYQEDDLQNICPLPSPAPTPKSLKKITLGEEVEDPNQELKDLSTDFVVDNFFTTEKTLFNFMKLIYGNIESALEKYKRKLELDEKAVTLLFKGGNVLRIVAKGVFDLIPEEARNFLTDKYAQYFKRSDADFAIYIDESKLKNLNYNRVLAKITGIALNELDNIRNEFQKNPQEYFDFFKLSSTEAEEKLNEFLKKLNSMKAVKDPNNANWYQAKFYQLQILDRSAKPKPQCDYHGQYDVLSIIEGEKRKDGKLVAGKIARIRQSEQPDWIVNTDNRTIEFPWGSDPTKIVKFFLVRSKIAFDAFFEKEEEIDRKPIVGELIDVSLSQREDNELKLFFENDNYDKNVATYTLVANGDGEQLEFKSYSLSYLADDLVHILFDSFVRPWQSGPKYVKRMNRLFFLHIVEMLGQFGLGSPQINDYVNDVKDNILSPLKSLYPINDTSSENAAMIIENVSEIKEKWKNMAIANEFWLVLANFVKDRLINAPEEEDQSGFTKFLETINDNMDNADQLGRMTTIEGPVKIDIQNIYNNVKMKNFL